MAPLRIAVLTSLPVTGSGGEEIFVRSITGELRRLGCSVSIIDPIAAGTSERLPARITDKMIRLPDVRRAWAVARSFRKRQHDFDVVLVNSLAGWALPGWPGVTVYHGTRAGYAEASQRGTGWPLPYLKSRRVVAAFETRSGHGRTVVAVSGSARDEVERYYRLSVTAVVPNGVELHRFNRRSEREATRRAFGLPQDRFLALFSGRPGRHKGTDILDAIAARLPTEILVVAAVPCDYPSHPAVRKLVGLRRDQLADLYGACDAFVFPSRWEGCSFSLIEALASGLPPVASRVGHMPDVLRAEPTLETVSPKTLVADDFVACLRRLNDDHDFCRAASIRARAYAQATHTKSVMANHYHDLLRAASTQ